MKCRLPRWCLFVLLGSLTFGSREASAQGKTNFARVEERQFLLYALENMSIQRVANTNKPGRPFEAPSVILGRFLARQRLLFDTMRRHVQKRKKTELVPLFEAYEKELNLRDDYRKALEKPWADYIKKMSAASSAASSRVLLTGLSYALAPVAEGEDERRNFARGMNAMFNTAIVEGEKLRMFGAGAAKEYGNALKKTDEEFSPRLEKSHKAFQEQLEDFVAANKTDDAEFAFQTAADAEPARNPFLLTAKAAAILKNQDASIKELMEQAEVCRRTAGMVPSDRVFNIYRAAFLGIAGTIANRAATKDLGATGFPSKPKDAPEAGKLAYKIWTAYSKVEPFDTNVTDEVVQAFILACAQAGYAASAQPVILKAVVQPRRFGRAALNVNASARPEFWYDCARVTSMLGNTRLSMDCLQQAVKLGFREKESAKVHPDLRNVREDSVTAATFKRLFP